MVKRSREEAEPISLWVRILVILVALGVIASGVWIAVSGLWADEGRVYAEGPLARAVGVAVAVLGTFGLFRSIFRWWKQPKHRRRVGNRGAS
jgi:hypothetical protein